MKETTFDTVKLIHGDCMDYMRTLPDNAFDLAVVDPPYGSANSEFSNSNGGGQIRAAVREIHGTGSKEDGENAIIPPPTHTQHTERQAATGRFQGGTWAERYRRCEAGVVKAPTWDVAPPQEYFDELFRVSKNQIIWGGNYFYLPPTRCFLVWEKTNIPENFTMAMCEYAWTSFKGNAKIYKHTSLRGKDSGGWHPTEKPIDLYGWILNNFAKSGNKILDTHLGSASSAIAAWELGFEFVGVEIDEYYYNKAVERLRRHTMQQDMFHEEYKQLNLFQ